MVPVPVLLVQQPPLDNGTFSNRTQIFTQEEKRTLELDQIAQERAEKQVEERALLVVQGREEDRALQDQQTEELALRVLGQRDQELLDDQEKRLQERSDL